MCGYDVLLYFSVIFFIEPMFECALCKKYVHSQWNYIHLLLSLGLCLRLRKNAYIKEHFQSQNRSTTAFELNTSFWNCWILKKRQTSYRSLCKYCQSLASNLFEFFSMLPNTVSNHTKRTRREWSRAHKWKRNKGVLSRLIKEQEKH